MTDLYEALASIEEKQAEFARLRKELEHTAKLLELGIVRHDIVGRRRIFVGYKSHPEAVRGAREAGVSLWTYENSRELMANYDHECEIKMRDGTLHRVPASLLDWEEK